MRFALASIQGQLSEEVGSLSEQARAQMTMWEANEQTAMIVVILLIGWGLANVLIGYRIFRWVIVLYGLLCGAVIGLIAGMMAQGAMVLTAEWLLPLTGVVIGAGVGGVLGWYLYYLIVFLFGMGLGTALAVVVGSQFLPELDPELLEATSSASSSVSPIFFIVALAVGFVAGILVLLAHRPLIVLYTSVYGAICVVVGVFDLIGRIDSPLRVAAEGSLDQQIAQFQSLPILLAVVLVSIIGVVIQLTMTARPTQGKLTSEQKRPEAR